jgi:FkbM family methyltransferase
MQRMTFGDLELSVTDPYERDTSYIYHEIFVTQIYYHPEMRMPRHPVVMDVGANIGVYSIWAHRRYQPRAIYCYEPSPHTFAYLEDNTARLIDGEITRVHASRCAITGKAGQRLALHQAPLISGLSTLLDRSRIDWVQSLADSGELVVHDVTTSTVSAEMAANGIGDVDLLKIDVEGYFMEVLAGIGEADFPRIRNIVLEIDYPEEAGATLASLDGMLRAKGYATDCEEETFYAWRR